MADNNTDKVKELSIQQRVEDNNLQGFAFNSWFNIHSDIESEVSPWWSQNRDLDLQDFLMKEGNDILQGAVSSLVKKFQAMNWIIEGAETVTKRYHPIVAQAEFGKGWAFLLSRTLQSYFSQDKGAFWELIGEGDIDGPIDGAVLGIANLDSRYCQLTGDIDYPVIYWSTKDSKPHKMHRTRIVHFVDMPSPNEDMNGIGFCAVSRVISASTVLLKIATYKNEKLSNLPQAGLLLLNNILPQSWNDAKGDYNTERRRQGEQYWKSVMTLFGLDPSQPATANFISFSNLPESFDELQSTELYVKILSLAFGVDIREFWPQSGGSLGTATESTIMHEKARGKAIGELISNIERAINWFVLPPTVSFSFDFKDDEQDRTTSEIQKVRIDSIMSMWRPPSAQELDYGLRAPVTRDEIRQMLADNVDYFSEDFLEVDVTDEVELTDTEKAKWLGNRIAIDRYGKVKTISKVEKHKAIDTLLNTVEKNYKDGLIDLDTVLEFRLGQMLEDRIVS